MSVMAKYARIFWAEPKDADVAARNLSVDTLRKHFGNLDSKAAIRLADAIASSFRTGKLADEFAAIVETAISEPSPAFELVHNQQQGAVCAAVAALELVKSEPIQEGTQVCADVFAVALWSATAFQEPGEIELIEALRTTLFEACRDRVQSVATESRRRKNVPDVGTLTISEADPAGSKAQSNYKRATAPVISALKENAELDREEIDFLWWALADYSNVLKAPLADKCMLVRALAAGIEAASMLRRLPSDGHRHAALRLVDVVEPVTLSELIEQINDDRALLRKPFTDTWVVSLPTVFPLLSALISNDDLSQSAVKLNAREWGARALLEAGIFGLERRVSGSK